MPLTFLDFVKHLQLQVGFGERNKFVLLCLN